MKDSSLLGTLDVNLDRPKIDDASARTRHNEYAELKQLIRNEGLLDKQPKYYAYKILSTVGLLALSIAFLLLVHNF